MPWLETVPVEQRARFIDDHRLGLYDMTTLCARYAISRKTGDVPPAVEIQRRLG